MAQHDAVRGQGFVARVACLLGRFEWPRPARLPTRDEADGLTPEVWPAGRVAAERAEIDWNDDDLLRALMA